MTKQPIKRKEDMIDMTKFHKLEQESSEEKRICNVCGKDYQIYGQDGICDDCRPLKQESSEEAKCYHHLDRMQRKKDAHIGLNINRNKCPYTEYDKDFCDYYDLRECTLHEKEREKLCPCNSRAQAMRKVEKDIENEFKKNPELKWHKGSLNPDKSDEKCACGHEWSRHTEDGCQVIGRFGDDDVYCNCMNTNQMSEAQAMRKGTIAQLPNTHQATIPSQGSLNPEPKVWVISDNYGSIIGRLREDEADDKHDAILNWADENLHAELMEKKDLPKEMRL